MFLSQLRKMGVTSDMAYCAGLASIGLTVLTWTMCRMREKTGGGSADHRGLFVAQWAPTFLALGIALQIDERAGTTK